MIDPSIWEDEHFGALSDKAKILFVALISNADDDGRLSANIANLRAIAFRFEQVSVKRVKDLLKELTTSLCNVKIYSINNREYIQLTKWEEYQQQREDRRKPSKIPPFDPDANDNQVSTTEQTNVGLREVKLSKDKLREDKIRDEWNTFASAHPPLSTIERISSTRKAHLQQRLEADHFVESFGRLLEAIGESPFLLGKNDKKWRVSFDWLIINDNNYLKVLEGRYKGEQKTGIERFMKED